MARKTAPSSRRIPSADGPEDVDSPLPPRTHATQNALTHTLLRFDTLAERLTHLLEHESTYYLLDDTIITDPDVIATQPRGLKQKLARIPYIARWVERRTGQPVSKQALYKFRDGELLNPRAGITNALEEFWRLQHLLLDPSVPASRFPDDTADASTLDDLERRTYELMNQIGFEGVRAREIKHTLGPTGTDERQAFLDVLEAIARDHSHRQDGNP